MECRFARLRDGKPHYAPSVIVNSPKFTTRHVGVLNRIVNISKTISVHGWFVLTRLFSRIVLYFIVCLLAFLICAHILEVRVPECLYAHLAAFGNLVQDSWMKWICLLFGAVTLLDVGFVCVGFVVRLIRLFLLDVNRCGPLRYMSVDQPLDDDGVDVLQRGAYVKPILVS